MTNNEQKRNFSWSPLEKFFVVANGLCAILNTYQYFSIQEQRTWFTIFIVIMNCLAVYLNLPKETEQKMSNNKYSKEYKMEVMVEQNIPYEIVFYIEEFLEKCAMINTSPVYIHIDILTDLINSTVVFPESCKEFRCKEFRKKYIHKHFESLKENKEHNKLFKFLYMYFDDEWKPTVDGNFLVFTHIISHE